MHILSSLIALVVMIPAGLAGIAVALKTMPASVDELIAGLNQLWTASRELAAWCEPLGCGILGVALLTGSAIIAWRGLQSRT